ncbi:MAG TPA: PKD domain-containing protein [Methanospirillum sp.]|uniref:PKD domain-containing protein n=1 Tax=Methanospirillum sp. TaxID=45200 RepID=UPI002CDFA3B3|nr:PKD domain-containing protein [Methanospirillum sp.]HWQ64092.1 PKD domain-containing protein [Methanospirillum sp.]
MNDLQGKCEVMAYKTAYPVIAGLLILAFLITGSMAEPQQKGVVFVNSVPAGAEIYLTNVSVSPDNLTVSDTEGLTPREFFVEPGTYRLFLKKYGFITWWNESFTVTPGTYLNFSTVTLTPNNPVYGAIHLDTNPSDSDLTLHREIPNVTSLIYSKTPASVESLPPGTYIYNITRSGYYPKNGTTEVTAGNVTELRINLDPIPETAPVTFKSDPTSADVYIYQISRMNADQQSTLVSKMDSALNSFNGSHEEVAAKIQNVVSTEDITPDYLKYTAGIIGNTTTTQQLYSGEYFSVFFKDRYHWGYKFFNVTANTPSTVEIELTPFTNYVQVYFETSIDDDDHPELGIPKGANVTYDGELQENRTPCWISLPAQKIVNVTFDRMPMNLPKTVTVDTTLFVGRPSKWGQIISLDRATYFIQAGSDAHSTIQPSGLIPVIAGETKEFTLSGEHPAYLAHNLTVDRTSEGKPVFNITYNLENVTYPHEKTLGNATLYLSSLKKQVAVNATAGKGGSVNNAGITFYDYGEDSAAYNFTPDVDNQVKQLYLDGEPVPYAPSYVIQGSKMTYNHTLYCTFRPTKVTVFTNYTTGGKIDPSDPYQVDYDGCTKNTTGVPDPGYYLSYLRPEFESGDSYMESEGFKTNFQICNLHTNLTWHAVFEKQWFNVTSTAIPANAGMIVPSGNTTATYGQTLTFNSTAFSGYQLADITDNGVSKGPVSSYTLNVTDNHEIVAHFQPDVLTIAAVAGQGGQIQPNGTVNVTFGNTQCFNITAFSNYFISNVEVDGISQGNNTSPMTYCFPNVTKNHSINASFSKYAYTITPSAGVGGTISPSTPQNVTIGDSINFNIAANPCYTIGDVIVDGKSNGPQVSPFVYTFPNVNADHTIQAVFQIKTYNILVNQSNGGNISPAGTNGIVQVNCGSNQTFTITPDAGNALYDLIVDNSSVGPINPYTFVNISSDHTIEPVFVLPPVPDFEADRIRVPPKYPVTFKDLTINNPTDWLWDFGDGEVTNVREPVHLYAKTGNYTVKLTAFNAAAPNGVTVEKKDYICVTTDPIACMMAKPQGGTVPPGLTVEFTDCSLNTDDVSWGWVFGDSSAGSLSKNISHTYTAPGVYQVTHQVDKPFIAKDYAYETITVMQQPVADFMAHPLSGKSPLSVQFEDKSQGFPTEWFWNFGDNTASYDQNPLHVYSTPGNYTVTLKVFSNEGTSEKVKDGYISVL